MTTTPIKENTHIFQDIDQCIVDAFMARSIEEAEAIVQKYSKYETHIIKFGGSEGWNLSAPYYYVAVLRPGAWQHVDWCRNLVGEKNYHILTNASRDWAVAVNNAFNLGFPLDQIFCRYSQTMIEPRFKDTNNVLIDNEDHDYHHTYSNKNKFLHGLPIHKLFDVEDFYPNIEGESDEYVQSWKEEILEIINL